MIVRAEYEGDEAVIAQVTASAFTGKAYSDQTEHLIVERLRKASALSLSLVVQEEGEIVGHIGFSPVFLEDGSEDWFALGPLSVRPDRQRRGVGSLLVRQGLSALESLNAAGCLLVGSPRYYPKFGFRQATQMLYPGTPAEYLMYLPLRGGEPSGIVRFHPAFYGSAA